MWYKDWLSGCHTPKKILAGQYKKKIKKITQTAIDLVLVMT
jgi:hypothetical protein